MNAKEWLIEQGFSENTAYLDCVTKEGFGYPLELLMERYKNNCTAELQAKILGFRQEIKNVDTSIEGTICIWNEDDALIKLESYYDNFFNITAVRNGTTK